MRGWRHCPRSSVHLVVTSPPYWVLKEYRRADGQLGWIEDYEELLPQAEGYGGGVLRSLPLLSAHPSVRRGRHDLRV